MIGFPLLLIPLAIVNIVVFLMGLRLDRLQEPVVTVGLPSLQSWTITFSDALLALGLFLLFLEVVKSARPGAKYVTDHLLSLIVFAAAAAEFLLLPEFAHSTFFLLMLMALTDVVAGITIRAVRPKTAMARAAPTPVDERPVSRPVAPEPAPPPRSEPVETRAAAPQPDEMPVTAEQRDVPIAPNQEILPPEPTGPRR
jgi:outer membrane biosynthesis protein TonB